MSDPTQSRPGPSLQLGRTLISIALGVGLFVSVISLNLVGHAKFIQTDRVLLVPIGKNVWSYGWPVRWMDKDISDREIEARRKEPASDEDFRNRWGIHHSPYDWVNDKYRVSARACSSTSYSSSHC